MTSRPLDSSPGAANSRTEKRVRADALSAAVAHSRALGGDNVGDLDQYLADYFYNVSAEDLQASDPIDLLGAALSNRQLGHHRRSHETLLRVYNPTVEENGWSNGHTVVEVVSDDMPFLVDSLSAAISGSGREIHLVIHSF